MVQGPRRCRTLCQGFQLSTHLRRGCDDLHISTPLALAATMSSNSLWPLCVTSISPCVQGKAASGRAVARILHGLHSPAFPMDVWSKCTYWGRYADVDFSQVVETAETEARSHL